MVPHALDVAGRRAITSEDGGNHSKLKEPLSGTTCLLVHFQ